MFKLVCNSATTLSLPNLALSRSYSLKFCGLLVDADRPRPLPLGLRSALKTDVMHCDFVVPLSLHKFLMKSRDATDLHQHRARVFVAEDGCQVTLFQLLECQSHEVKFVLLFGSSLWYLSIGFSHPNNFHALTFQILGKSC